MKAIDVVFQWRDIDHSDGSGARPDPETTVLCDLWWTVLHIGQCQLSVLPEKTMQRLNPLLIDGRISFFFFTHRDSFWACYNLAYNFSLEQKVMLLVG